MELFHYPVTVRETHLDSFGHMNNADYLVLFEEARWEILHARGFALKAIVGNKVGPVVLEINIRFQKELRVRDAIIIESQCVSYEGKVAHLSQVMKRGEEVCCTATLTLGLFDLASRRLIAPTPQWLHCLGVADKAMPAT